VALTTPHGSGSPIPKRVVGAEHDLVGTDNVGQKRNARGSNNTVSKNNWRKPSTGSAYSGMDRVIALNAAERVRQCAAAMRRIRLIPKHPEYADPVDGFRQLFFDTVLVRTAGIALSGRRCRCDKIMLGSDYPFGIGDPTRAASSTPPN